MNIPARVWNVISNKINMKYSDNSPRRQILLRVPWPLYRYLEGEAKHNNITITELARYYFYHGFNRDNPNRSKIILDRARKQSTME